MLAALGPRLRAALTQHSALKALQGTGRDLIPGLPVAYQHAAASLNLSILACCYQDKIHSLAS